MNDIWEFFALVSNLFKIGNHDLILMFYLRKQNLNFKINFYNIGMTYTHVGEIQGKRRKENKKMREFSTY